MELILRIAISLALNERTNEESTRLRIFFHDSTSSFEKSFKLISAFVFFVFILFFLSTISRGTRSESKKRLQYELDASSISFVERRRIVDKLCY